MREHTIPDGSKLLLRLGNGLSYEITSTDPASSRTLHILSKTLNIDVLREERQIATGLQRITVKSQSILDSPALSYDKVAGGHSSEHVVVLPCLRDENSLFLQLVYLSLPIVRSTIDFGGLLVHGALCEFANQGIILAGPGGAGKTTASSRLKYPWSTLSDDATLIVVDRDGHYWCHPWPTWSTFALGGKGGVWDASRYIPLRGIFFLVKDCLDYAEMIGKGEAAVRLQASSEQVSHVVYDAMSDQTRRVARLKIFESICSLIRNVPSFKLHASLQGSFWTLIEQALFKKQRVQI